MLSFLVKLAQSNFESVVVQDILTSTCCLLYITSETQKNVKHKVNTTAILNATPNTIAT